MVYIIHKVGLLFIVTLSLSIMDGTFSSNLNSISLQTNSVNGVISQQATLFILPFSPNITVTIMSGNYIINQNFVSRVIETLKKKKSTYFGRVVTEVEVIMSSWIIHNF